MSTLALPPGRSCGPAHHVAHARKSKGGYTRQRRGCLTCRQRKKKCDQVLPLCGHCSRLNLVCKREQPRELHKLDAWGEDAVETASALPWPSTFSQGTLISPIYEPLDLIRPETGSDQDLSASRRSMMRYYTSTLANMLSATSTNNCFLSVLLPMAFDCPTLLDAMSAWSSAHLALRDPSFHAASLQHRGRVLANLSAAIQDNSLSEDMCLAVAMTMCSMATISDATTSSWAHHLTGAAAAFQSKVAPMAPRNPHANENWLHSFEGKWLLRNFAYHDVLMSVSLDRRPLLAGDYWMSADDALADPYCAFASRVIFLTSEISILNADCAEQMHFCSLAEDEPVAATDHGHDDDDDNDDYGSVGYESLLQRAHDVAARLREWECPRAVSSDAPLALLSDTYRSAALIYLGRVLRRHFPGHVAKVLPEGVATYVASICETAIRVPEGSNEECSLLFPLFMAGGEAEAANHMQVIRDRLLSMNKWRGFRNVDACREVLDEVWGQKLEGANGKQVGGVDWRDVVKNRGWQLALS